MSCQFSIIIPAIINSTSLLCPITAQIDGQPLIVKVALQAQKTNAINVIVATDHQEIINICNQFGIKAVMTSFTHNSGTERIIEIVKKLKINHMVVNLKADAMFISSEIITSLVDYTITNNLAVATLATKVSNIEDMSNTNIVKVVVNKNSHAMYFSRNTIPFCRSGLLIDYILNNKKSVNLNFNILRHIGIYSYSADFLLNYSKLEDSDLEHLEGLEQLKIMYNAIAIGVLLV
jgi:3-deoxy-manno-octulosonate cytidylyltransferase (CMP-KDO synthetase)